MSNTTIIVGNFLQIKGLDADWSLLDLDATFLKTGIRVKSITFFPSATGDIIHIKESDPGYATTAALVTALTATAPSLLHVDCADVYDQRIKYFGGENGRIMRPFIDISDCVFTTAATCRVEMELA